MNDTYLLGIDLGTSGCRTTCYDMKGNVTASGKANLDGQSSREWGDSIRKSCPELPEGRKICSADSTSGTVVLTDEKGKMVFPPLMYYESAPKKAEEIAELEAAKELENKGVSISGTSPLPKILKLKEKNPRKFQKVEWILNPTTWVLHKLRYREGKKWDKVKTDWTNALKFGADIRRNSPKWFSPLFREVEIKLDLLPPIRSPGEYLGEAESNFSRELGLQGAELYLGLSDGNASALAMGCLEPGDYGITCGSTSVVKFVSEDVRPHEAIYYHKHPIKGYLAGGAFETGIVLRWFSEKVLGMSQAEALQLARETESGEEYTFFPQGNRSPFFNSRMGNTLTDFWPDMETSKEEVRGKLARGIASGIALAEYCFIPLFENLFEKSIDSIYLLGGGAPSQTDEEDPFDWWNRLRASIWNRNVSKMEPRTTLGPLIPAALTANLFDNVGQASKTLLRKERKIEIDDIIAEKYSEKKEEYFRNWKELNQLSKFSPDTVT